MEVPVCLVGNKQDLCHVRQVYEEEGRCLAQENHCTFQEVSAAESYQDIANLFTRLIRQTMEHLKYRADRRRYSGSKSMAKLINNVFGKRRKSVWRTVETGTIGDEVTGRDLTPCGQWVPTVKRLVQTQTPCSQHWSCTNMYSVIFVSMRKYFVVFKECGRGFSTWGLMKIKAFCKAVRMYVLQR